MVEPTALTHPAPQLFPGLIYRMVKPKVVLLIFVSGKIVLTGAKVRTGRMVLSVRSETDGSSPVSQHRDEIYQAFAQIYPVLNEYRKP